VNEPLEQRRTRRGILQVATAGLAGIVGLSLGKVGDARAADGSPLLSDQDNASGGTTAITSTTATSGKGVLEVTGTNADYGVVASGSGVGLYGKGPIGVLGDGAVGGVFQGTDASVSLTPRGSDGPPSGSNLKGDVAVDASGVLWMCIADGSPGTWIRVSHGGVRPLPSPVRVLSSSEPGAGGKLGAGETRRVQIIDPVQRPTIPAEALAIVGNLTVFDTQGGGYVIAYPSGTPRPFTSNVNWNTPNVAVANAMTVGLNGGAIDLYADASVPPGSSATHVIIDVAAYIL
jgi:hypothetical protein